MTEARKRGLLLALIPMLCADRELDLEVVSSPYPLTTSKSKVKSGAFEKSVHRFPT